MRLLRPKPYQLFYRIPQYMHESTRVKEFRVAIDVPGTGYPCTPRKSKVPHIAWGEIAATEWRQQHTRWHLQQPFKDFTTRATVHSDVTRIAR